MVNFKVKHTTHLVTITNLSHKDYQNHCAFKNAAYCSTRRVLIWLCVL